MGEAYLMRRGGSGTGLRAVSYASMSDVKGRLPKNTIVVVSEIPSIYVYVQLNRPEAAETGDVWARIKGGNDISVYAPKSSLEVGIDYVEQYNGEKWVRVRASVSDGKGAFRVVSDAQEPIYNRGNTVDDITGGWSIDKNSGMTLTFGAESAVLAITGDANRYATAYTNNKIDLTKYREIGMVVSNARGRGASGTLYLGATTSVYMGGTGSELLASFKAGTSLGVSPDKKEDFSEETTMTVDISELTGSYYIQFGAAIADATVHEIYLV